MRRTTHPKVSHCSNVDIVMQPAGKASDKGFQGHGLIELSEKWKGIGPRSKLDQGLNRGYPEIEGRRADKPHRSQGPTLQTHKGSVQFLSLENKAFGKQMRAALVKFRKSRHPQTLVEREGNSAGFRK